VVAGIIIIAITLVFNVARLIFGILKSAWILILVVIVLSFLF
jgi:hypothetical protein